MTPALIPLVLPLLALLGQQAAATNQAPASAPAASPAASAQLPEEPQTISDNSFLIEEAYNQERGVVQHISLFTRDWTEKTWVFGFTQEWPVNAAPRNQISYSIGALSGSPGQGDGVGDVWINYRYQVVSGDRVAVAPRASVIFPTGNALEGRGNGGAGVEFALPVSVTPSKSWALHSNAGTTIVDNGENEAGERATTVGAWVGQSFVWMAKPRINLLVEAIYRRQQDVTGAGQTTWETDFVLSPGIRWAYNFKNGLQIVPGVAVPINFHKDAGNDWTILGYLSLEHPFGHRK